MKTALFAIASLALVAVNRGMAATNTSEQTPAFADLSTVPALDVGDLPRGCVPRAVLFVDTVRAVRPEIRANVTVTEQGKHAVAVLSDGKRVFGYDGYNGGFSLGNDMALLRAPYRFEKKLQEFVTKQIMVAYERGTRVLDIEGEMTKARALNVVGNLIARMAKDRLPMAFGYSTDEGEQPCAMFVYSGRLYVYSPFSGTLSRPIPEGEEIDMLSILADIGKKKYGSKKFEIVAYPALNNPQPGVQVAAVAK
ncbi:hypothetical protein [Oleiharenicola sp. Vm1]|uniref:hypothetical protein n=1 Tax=Oleiharenicola sp. Vm1 TaxID=3398393 RepID=UPI0039F48F42